MDVGVISEITEPKEWEISGDAEPRMGKRMGEIWNLGGGPITK